MKLKRIGLLLMITLLSVVLLSCQQQDGKEEQEATTEGSASVETTEQEAPPPETEEPEVAEETKEAKKKEKTIYVKREEVEYKMEVFEDMEQEEDLYPARMVVINHSKYPIRNTVVSLRKPGSKDMIEFYFPNAIMPDQTSSYTYRHGLQDMDMVYMRYVVFVEEENENYEITYNLETDKYIVKKDQIIELNYIPNEEVKVPFEKFEFDYVTYPPNDLGIVASDVTMVNNSDYTVKSMIVNYHNHDENSESIFGLLDSEVPAGATADFPRSFGGKDMTIITAQYVVEVDGKEYSYSYDKLLDRYELLNAHLFEQEE